MFESAEKDMRDVMEVNRRGRSGPFPTTSKVETCLTTEYAVRIWNRDTRRKDVTVSDHHQRLEAK